MPKLRNEWRMPSTEPRIVTRRSVRKLVLRDDSIHTFWRAPPRSSPDGET